MMGVLQRLTGDAEADGEEADVAVEPTVETAVPDHGDVGLARSLVVEQLQRADEAFDEAWETDGDLHSSVEALRERHGWRSALAALESYGSERSDPELVVHVDGRALVEAYHAVFDDPGVETIVYLTGLNLGDGVTTINRVESIPHREQTAVRAEGDPEGQFAVLDRLDEQGFQLLGHLHNHGSRGVAGTQPSPTDLEYQEGLEGLGYDAVGFIATEDGFVRAYSADREFEVTVHGNMVATHDREQHTFRLGDGVQKQ